MVRHQDIGGQGTAIPSRGHLHVSKLPTIIVIAEENHMTIISALNDVKRLSRHHNPWQSGHPRFPVLGKCIHEVTCGSHSLSRTLTP